MLPVLFRIPLPWGDPGTYFPIRMFGVLVILGFLAGTWLVGRRLAARGIMDREQSFDFCFYLLAVGIAGSRILYFLQNTEEFRGHAGKVFAIWEGGLVWYGGFAASAVFAFAWLAKRKLPVLEVTDALAMGLALALAIGRWGCFCAGDDYGAKVLGADGNPIEAADQAPWWAVQFPNPTEGGGWPYYQHSETSQAFRAPYWLHPVQIYMSLANFVVLGALFAIGRLRAAAARPGVLTAAYLMLYPVARFVCEYWRGDADRGEDVVLGLSFSQAFGVPVFLVGVALLRFALTRPARRSA